ncbi:MAG: hypothetical protein ACI92G_000252 [Candidatus Pelagisphaera sp.]|jgi:hypothetical protein
MHQLIALRRLVSVLDERGTGRSLRLLGFCIRKMVKMQYSRQQLSPFFADGAENTKTQTPSPELFMTW